VVYEHPRAEGDPYYPIPRPENTALYRKYQALAEQTRNVHFVGRLATYKYYNMDQVVAQALTLYKKLRGTQPVSSLGLSAATPSAPAPQGRSEAA
jgi:UDP-galactopyranose mutase